MDDVRIVNKGKQELPCRLTEAEQIARGRALAKAIADVTVLKSRQQSVAQQLKAEAAALDAERDKLSEVVSSGTELREVETEDQVNFLTGRFTRRRLDTDEVLIERALTPDEAQLSMERGMELVPSGGGESDEPMPDETP